jgi:hypothetical protein
MDCGTKATARPGQGEAPTASAFESARLDEGPHGLQSIVLASAQSIANIEGSSMNIARFAFLAVVQSSMGMAIS